MEEPLPTTVPCQCVKGLCYVLSCLCCLKFCIILLGSCSFGSGKGDCFQVLYFKLAKDDKGFESMIRSCSCTKSSSSPLHNPNLRQSSKSCKSCGGKIPVEGRGARRGSMLSNGGLELSRVIDPHLTWKTASNGRQRAVRRARTSFIGLSRKYSFAMSSKAYEDSTDKDSKSTGDMPVSESEKVGVGILGRRFSDTLGSVPIKKRRFLLPHSPSPLHHSSPYYDDSGHTLERKTAPYQDARLNANQHSLDINLCSRSVLGQGRKSGSEKIDLDGVNKKICDAADFSGISILAAAACDSNIGGEFTNVGCSLSKLHPSEVQGVPKENAKSELSSLEKEDAVLQTSEDLVGRTDLPSEVSSSSALPSKESNEVKSDGSSNLEASVDSSQNAPNRAADSSSRDVKFHWDLNTVMDVWESHEVLNSDQEATNNWSNDADHNEKLGNVEHSMDQVGFGDTKIMPTDSQTGDNKAQAGAGERKVICASELKTEDNLGVSSDNSASDFKENKLFFSDHGATPSEEQYMKDAKMCVADACEETKSLISNGQSYSTFGNFPFPTAGAEASAAAVVDFSLSNVVVEEGKAEALSFNFHLKVENGNSSSCLVSCDNKIVDYPTSVTNPHHELDKRPANPHHELDKRPAEARTDVQVEEITPTRSPQAENQESLCVGSTDVNLLVACLTEKGSEVLADENIYENMVSGDVISGAYAHKNPLDETGHADADKSGGKECECETTAVEMKMDNADAHNDNMDTDDMDAAKSDLPVNIGFEVSVCKSTEMTHGTDAPPALTSQGPCENNTDGSASNPGQVALENYPECHYYPDASQNDADQAPGMEKIEFLGDDDSQYEDGEFRESLANCWLDDVTEEGETERVDYGTDRDTDVCEAASDFSFVNQHVVNNAGLSGTSYDDIQYQVVGRDTQNTSRSFLNFPSPANVSDVGSGKNAGSATRTGLQGSLRTAGIDASEGNDVGDNGFVKEAYDARRSGHSASLRKMSGWDQLPGASRSSGNGVMDFRVGSISRIHNDTSLDPYRAADSIIRAAGSSLRRDLSSRMERVQSSDMSRRNDKSYVRPSRSNDRNGFNPRLERDRDEPRSIGRSGPSLHLHGRGRGDHWVDSSNHYGNSRHDSSGYYGSPSFPHRGSSNAAAAAVAKVESNGFVVAPDGTIVKAGGAGSAGHLTLRSAKASSQNTHRSPVGRGSPIERERPYGMSSGPGRSREMSPDGPMFAGRGKPGRFGPGMDGVSYRERYRGSMPNDIIDSSLSMRHTISRRDHSFSPHRRPLHLSRSHSRSPSRSRTRSPHRWASPRGRGNGRTNGGPGIRRRSRSPNFKSEVRMDRPRAGFGERIANYASLSRNHTSPPHVSRWIDGSKEIPEHLRDYEYRRRPGRSPPGRVFSRSHRVDLIDSPGRVKPDEYYRPTNSGRFPELNGFGRGFRHDGKGDVRREHGDRYEVLHSTRQYVNDGNMKRLRYNNENGFMAQNLRSKSSEFPRRESPRAIDRGTERQLGDSPRRSTKEEKGNFGNGKDGSPNTNLVSEMVMTT